MTDISEDDIQLFYNRLTNGEKALSTQTVHLTAASPYGLLYRTTLAAALRKGEVLALSWRQINFERKSIMIDQQIALRPLPDGTSHYTLVPYTKNRKRQSIHPLKEIFQPLKEEKERQLLLCLQREIP